MSDDNNRGSVRWSCGPHILWSVLDDGLLVINRRSGATRRMGYPEAAVWDLLSRGRSMDQVHAFLGAVLKTDQARAQLRMDRFLELWSEAGFFEEDRLG